MERILTDVTNTPDPVALAAENVSLRNALESVRADYAKHQSETLIVAKGANESQAALATALRERDAFKTQVAELEPRAKLVPDLEAKITGYVNATHEAALLAALLPKCGKHAPVVIRSTLAHLHDAGKIDRFSADTAAAAAKALELFATDAPSLLQPPTTQPSGPSAVRPVATPGAYRGPFAKK